MKYCEVCKGAGWLYADTGCAGHPDMAIQRCDACGIYESDEEALEAVVLLARQALDDRRK